MTKTGIHNHFLFQSRLRQSALLVLLLGLFLLPACLGPKEELQGNNFLYFPLRNIYFDQDKNKYYVYVAENERWERRSSLSKSDRDSLGKGFVVADLQVPVYKDNAKHQIIYGTALYADKESLEQKFEEDSIASLPPIPAEQESEGLDSTAEAEEGKAGKKRSKFRRWLDKVFKKKE